MFVFTGFAALAAAVAVLVVFAVALATVIGPLALVALVAAVVAVIGSAQGGHEGDTLLGWGFTIALLAGGLHALTNTLVNAF